MTARPPVFLLGSPRSGTSLLYRLLCLHPEVTYVNQYMRRAPALPLLSSLNRLPRAARGLRDRIWFTEEGNAYVYGRRRTLGERLLPQPVEGEPFFASRGLSPGMAPAAVRAWSPDALRQGAGRAGSADGGRVLVSKRINHNRRIEALFKAFPDARFVHLVRDGRAVALSLTKVDWWSECDLWWMDVASDGGASAGEDTWALASLHWEREVTVVDQGLEVVPDDQVLTMAYEELIRSPTQVMDEARRFSGLAVDGNWLERVAEHPFPPPGDKWRGALTPHQVMVAEDLVGPTLVRHGYALAGEREGRA